MQLRMPCPCSGIICDVKITPVIICLFLSPVYGIPCYEIVDEIDTHGNITQTHDHSYAVTFNDLYALTAEFRPNQCSSICCIFL
jgi:hypothetical protein